MKIQVNGINLFFDIEGAAVRTDRNAMREVPTVILLHGGPGADHSIYKPDFTALTDVAQVIYLDHRGNGRSDDRPPELWTLAQWEDDLVAFCDALGIVKPVLYGASLGGMVAMTYATRHPEHAGKLVLVSTSAQATSHTDAKIAMLPWFGGWGGAVAGELDPMLPIACQRDIAAAIPQRLHRYREFENCRHGVIPDAPIEAMALLREFITA